MANASIISRIQKLIHEYESGALSLHQLTQQLDFLGSAIEKLPFADYKRLQQISQRLEVQAQYADERCEFEARVADLLAELRRWIADVPD